MRWISVIGRTGTVFLMVGLALGLFFLIPPSQSPYRGGTFQVEAGEYVLMIERTVLTPESGIVISINSTRGVNAYILKIDAFRNWWPGSLRNLTILNTILQNSPDAVLWKSDTRNTVTKDFFPTVDLNASILAANPSVGLAQVEWKVSNLMSIVPRYRFLFLLELIIPTGVVLAIPWIYYSRVRKDKTEGTPTS
jgi:hypothetical protein